MTDTQWRGPLHHAPADTPTDTILPTWRIWQQAQRLSSRTIDERERVVRHLLEHAGVGPLELTPMHVMMFVGRPELKANAAATFHASIRAYCQWLVRAELRADDPTLKTPTPKRVKTPARPLPDGDLAQLLGVVTRRRTRMMILLAAAGGLRVHEVAKFHGDDLDRQAGTFTVTGKGGDTELVIAHHRILEEAEHFPVDDWWFPSYEAQTEVRPHLSRAAVYSAISGAMHRAGIVGTPHQLRHWFATTLLDRGVDVRIVQEMMRHKSILSTQGYTKVHVRQMRAAMALLELPDAA